MQLECLHASHERSQITVEHRAITAPNAFDSMYRYIRLGNYVLSGYKPCGVDLIGNAPWEANPVSLFVLG